METKSFYKSNKAESSFQRNGSVSSTGVRYIPPTTPSPKVPKPAEGSKRLV